MKVVVNMYGSFNMDIDMQVEYLLAKGIKTYKYEQTNFERKTELGENVVTWTKCENPSEHRDLLTTFDYGEEFKTVGNPYMNKTHELAENIIGVDGENVKRNDSDLVAIVERKRAEDKAYASNVKIIEIPDDVEFEIFYDGDYGESIHEVHRSWYPE